MLKSSTEYLIKKYEDFVFSREIYFNYLTKFDSFSSSILKHTIDILFEHNTTFHFERKGNKRDGALTQKVIKNENFRGSIKIIKIRRDVSFGSQIHIYFHELVHLINNHYDFLSVLSTPQKEYVAEVTAQALMYSFCGGKKICELENNGKWEKEKYIERWIERARISKEKENLMWEQIENSYTKISKKILEVI